MSTRVWVGMATLALTCPPALAAQDLPTGRCRVPLGDPLELAAHFAPNLHFGPDETDFPTLPFFTAFDGRNNLGGPRRDFADLDEIAVPSRDEGDDRPIPTGAGAVADDPSLRASWDAMYEVRDSAPRAVFFEIDTLDEKGRHELWRFLKKDGQAWRRFDMDRLWPDELQDSMPILVVEYYFYYLNDWGLEGHEQDIEFVYVFVPDDPARACAFNIVVGAGHVPRTPNNILVRFGGTAEGRPDILVELGGHASAPTRAPHQRFSLGYDVNWHSPVAWGSRDLLAVSGTAFRGGYQNEMTFPRIDGEHADLRVAEAGTAGYALLPVPAFRRLAEAVEVHEDADSVRIALDDIATHLDSFDPPAAVTPAQMDRLRLWGRGLRVAADGPQAPSKHRIWEHRNFRLTEALILKEHLYPPSWKSTEWRDIGTLITYGLGGFPNEAYEMHLGVILPTDQEWLPIKIPGFVELQASWVFRDRPFGGGRKDRGWMFSAVYEREYMEMIGWYVRGSWMPHRDRLLPDERLSEVTLSGGLSLLLWNHDLRRLDDIPGTPNILRVHLGPRLDLVKWDRLMDRVGFEIILSLRQ